MLLADATGLVEALDPVDVTFVGHSIGGGEVARHIGRHGETRASKPAFVAAVTPFLRKAATNPGGAPIEVFDAMHAAVQTDRSHWNKDAPSRS